MKSILFVPYKNTAEECITIPKLAKRFLEHGIEVILIQLDDPIENIPPECEIIVDTGWKFELAFKYLWDREFDTVFLWDSDIDPLDFNPTLFISCMKKFWLDTAHPTLTRDSYQDWIDGFRNEEVISESFHGRYMSFLPVMCLTYSYRGWSILKSILGRKYTGELWSYGFAQTGNKGFVDSMNVRHTRMVTPRITGESSFEKMNANMHDAYLKYGVQHPCYAPKNNNELGKF